MEKIVRTCSCTLAGVLAPQLISFPRPLEFFAAGGQIVDAPWILAIAALAIVLALALLPRAWRADLL
jgi:hypothetical protein